MTNNVVLGGTGLWGDLSPAPLDAQRNADHSPQIMSQNGKTDSWRVGFGALTQTSLLCIWGGSPNN
eukprot:5069102-Heterocapsa_arctica.AAC.1